MPCRKKGKGFWMKVKIRFDKLFFAFGQLPQGLNTNHNKVLTYNYGMTASGEVVTEDPLLIERFFYSIRKIFN